MAQVGGSELAAYRRYVKGRFSENTMRPRMMVAREWVRRHPDVEGLTYREVEEYLRDRQLSASSTRNLVVCLRAFYRWLLREGLATIDPTLLVDRPSVAMRLPRPAPDQVVGRLIARANIQLRAMLGLMACAGLRCVECARLDWRDVDLEHGIVIANGKGLRERAIGLSPDVVRALRALRLSSTSKGAVFVGPSGRRLQAFRVSQLVNQYMHGEGESITAHQLRHRAATEMYRLTGGDLLAVRDFLGHASVSTTQIYAKIADDRVNTWARQMEFPAA